MPEESNQERLNNRLDADFNQPQIPGMEDYNDGIQIPMEKQTAERAYSRDRDLKNAASMSDYLKSHVKDQAKINALQKAYKQNLKEISQMRKEDLKREAQGLKIQKEYVDSMMKGNQVAKQRVQEAVATERAAQQVGYTPETFQGVTAREALTYGQGSRAGRVARLPGRALGGIGAKMSKNLGEIGAVETLTSPAGIMNLIRANPAVATAFAGIEAMQIAQNFEQSGIGGVPLIGRFLNQIPGAQPLTAFGTTTRAGQMTGEGYGAGIAAAREGFQLGANPFDTISNEVAKSIVESVRGQGFRGAMAREFENSIKDIYKDTGLPIEQVAAMGEIYARGGRLDEFRASIEQLDTIAKDSSQSIQTVAASFQQLQDTLVGEGTVANRGLPFALTEAISKLPGLSSTQVPQVTSFMAQGSSLYTGFQGVAAQTPFARRFFERQLGAILPQLRQSIEGLPQEMQTQQIANWLAAGMLPGITSIDVARKVIMGGETMMKNIEQGKRHYMTEAKVGSIFGEASRAQDKAADSIFSFKLHRDTGRSAYIEQLERGARSAGVPKHEIDAIVHDLRKNKSDTGLWGGADWGASVKRARARLEHDVQQRVNRHQTINIKLDSAETKRLLGGKNVKKSVNMEDAFHGAARVVGTAFGDIMPG